MRRTLLAIFFNIIFRMMVENKNIVGGTTYPKWAIDLHFKNAPSTSAWALSFFFDYYSAVDEHFRYFAPAFS